MYIANIFSVMVASPSDTTAERSATQEAIIRWNSTHARHDGVVLLPAMWEFAIPTLRRGSDPQAELNWMVDRADCLVAFFNTKIGSSTARAKTGTIEEIERALERGIPVHLFTSSKGFPREISPEQIEALNETIEHYRRLGIVGQYNTIESLRSDLYSVFDADIAAIASRIPEPFDSNQLLCWLLESHSAPTAPTTPILRIENTGDDDVYLKRVVVIGNDGTVRQVVESRTLVRGKESVSRPIVDVKHEKLRGASVELRWQVSGRTYNRTIQPRRSVG